MVTAAVTIVTPAGSTQSRNRRIAPPRSILSAGRL
jgi:hypothetical protein